jgi:hypothetical protein
MRYPQFFSNQFFALLAGLLLVVITPVAVFTQFLTPAGNEITSGDFHSLKPGLTIAGHVTMIRTPHRTIVNISQVIGLEPNRSYAAYVLDRPCDGLASGERHYQHRPQGEANPDNEIWPAVATNELGAGRGYAVHRYPARPEASAVAIHANSDGGPLLACADLE